MPEHDVSPIGQGKEALTPRGLGHNRVQVGMVVLHAGTMADGQSIFAQVTRIGDLGERIVAKGRNQPARRNICGSRPLDGTRFILAGCPDHGRDAGAARKNVRPAVEGGLHGLDIDPPARIERPFPVTAEMVEKLDG